MKLETISMALNELDERFISEAVDFRPGGVKEEPERILHMNTRKKFISIALAAALLLALGITAYAAWNIHRTRQQEIKSELRIDASHVSNYTEYAVPEEKGNGLTLLSSVNDGEFQRIYGNISPVTREEAEGFPTETVFSWSLEGTDIVGLGAYPALPADLTLHGQEEIREAVLRYAYDEESETLTISCYVDLQLIEKAGELLGTENPALLIEMASPDGERSKIFGPVSIEKTGEQRRTFDFNHALYRDAESGKEMEIIALELTPFTAVWSVSYEGADAVHAPGADGNGQSEIYMALEDKVGIDSVIYFSDGTAFSTGGALTSPCEDGVVKLNCGWGRAVNIEDVQKIVLGELVLWENK